VWPFTKKVDPLTELARAQAPAPPPKETSSWFSNPIARLRGSLGTAGAGAGAGAGAATGATAGAAPGATAGAATGATAGAATGATAGAAAPVAAASGAGSTMGRFLPTMPTFTRQPAVDPALKTSTGLFKSVVEDVNWVRANNKNMIKGAEPTKEIWIKGNPGINRGRAEKGLPASYSNMEFNDYDPNEYKNFKKKNGTWVTEVGKLTPKPGHGRFYGRDYPDLLKTIESFKKSYKTKRNSNYTRRWAEYEAKVKRTWDEEDKTAVKAVSDDLVAMEADYNKYLTAVKARIDIAYKDQQRDFLKKARVARQKAAEDFAKIYGYAAPMIKMNGNNGGHLTNSFENSMKKASVLDPATVKVQELKFLKSAEAAAAARAPLIQAARNAAAAAAAATPAGGTGLLDALGAAMTGATGGPPPPPSPPPALPPALPPANAANAARAAAANAALAASLQRQRDANAAAAAAAAAAADAAAAAAAAAAADAAAGSGAAGSGAPVLPLPQPNPDAAGLPPPPPPPPPPAPISVPGSGSGSPSGGGRRRTNRRKNRSRR